MRFELVKELGHGSTGVVFQARDLESGAIVALKWLNSNVGFGEGELLLARNLAHPNICTIHGLFHENDQAFISMQLVDGESLQDLLERGGPRSLNEALRLIRQIIDGLEAVHTHGMVHRNLNPRNVLIGRDGAVKLTDFGIGSCPTDVPADLDALGRVLRQVLQNVPDVPAWVKLAVNRCTATDPADRYHRVAQLREALREPFWCMEVELPHGFIAICA